MQLQPKSSPFVFIIPFAIMFAVVGIAMFAASSGTDLRSHASNNKEKQCAAVCTKLGGSTAACVNVCPKVLSGDMSCDEAASAIGARSKLFITACNRIAPQNRTCDQVCGGIDIGNSEGAGVAKNVCRTVCKDVSGGAKTCDQSCSGVLSSVPRGDSFLGACKTMCMKIPVKPTSGTGTPSISPTPVAGFSRLTCESTCKPPKTMSGDNAAKYTNQCMSICNDISSGSKSCPTACAGLGSYWGSVCKQKFCSQ